jgi:carbon monoxide dehydrogenase subunit G
MHFSTTIDVAAPPERVWSVMSDIERWPDWTPTVTTAKRLDSGPLTVGSKVRLRQPKLLPAVFTVTWVDANRGFAWTTSGPAWSAIARHTIEPTPTGSRVTLSLQFGGLLGNVIARVMRDLNERYIRLEAAGLKRQSEGTASPELGRPA